ncbi:protein-disulfide reductase DsbD [Acinetobacter courvalinii]|uniref:protein-disulfide reductase DsbD n=1 Tax=Acinetobacter courvalinii TaxID=280147 RepID=UPI0021CFDD0F|nr:protein-disulfide reductase DsbD [Acinetobacter courvalinii]MCU4638605.1 protein-disulfide reductase DsbD [Acinetobacter courvalinii]
MRFQLFIGMILGLNTVAWAGNDFLHPDQAFKFQASSISKEKAELNWDIVPNYYLYHDQFKLSVNGKNIDLKLPKGQEKDDPTFGKTDVHYHQVTAQFEVQPNQLYSVQWQGCADDGLCYPVQRTTIQTDATGLLPQQKLGSAQTKLALLVQEPEKTTDTSEPLNREDVNTDSSGPTQAEAIKPSEPTQQINDSKDTANIQQDSVTQSTTAAAEPSGQQPVASKTFKQAWNNDQFFLRLLSSQTVWLNLIAFLGFGVLLAFLPCSLPLIPILSSILVQQNKRRKAALIALTFVTSMALVYAVMGFVVSQIGFNVQRWFQNPMVIGLFVLMFIAFALNLFGLYQLSLPQSVLQRLDRIQQGQKGGTLFSAAIMGALSALIVGPCMSAPLAGALLYVSQLEHGMLGGLYLFLMGLGIGIPIFIASVFGAKYLPKPGLWMERLKFCFGFVMLALAVYFARPLLASALYYSILALVLIAMAAYLIVVLRYVQKLSYRLMLLGLVGVLTASSIWQIHLATSSFHQQRLSSLHAWIVVRTQHELEQALAQHPNQAVLIDVYADWCVACQPIERDILPSAAVQAAIENVVRIKLDLTHYEASQDIILKNWQILGPPTVLFLDPSHQEIRDLRLTGTYSAKQLVQNIQSMSGGK